MNHGAALWWAFTSSSAYRSGQRLIGIVILRRYRIYQLIEPSLSVVLLLRSLLWGLPLAVAVAALGMDMSSRDMLGVHR